MTEKPVVYYHRKDSWLPKVGSYPFLTLASEHHALKGTSTVFTSQVQKVNEDGSFETLNTLYKPAPSESV